jgi:hypothetical protein
MRVRLALMACLLFLFGGHTYADEKIDQGYQAGKDIGFNAAGKYGSESGVSSYLAAPFIEGIRMTTLDESRSGYECPATRKHFKTYEKCAENCEEECVQGFSVTDVFTDNSMPFLEVTIAPSQGGDIHPVFVRVDTDFDGAYDSNTQIPVVVSGVCADGIISCDSGTWNNCSHYAWTANENLQVFTTTVSPGDIGGCFCINASCGTNLVWKNMDTILNVIGDGIAEAIHRVKPQCVIKRTSVDAENMRIIYHGILSSSTNVETGNNIDSSPLDYAFRSGIDDPEKFYESSSLLVGAGESELVGQSIDDRSLWALTQQTAGDGVEKKSCVISHDVEYSTTWSCLITCYISNAGGTFLDSEITRSTNVPGICAMAYDRCSSGLYGEYYGDAPYDFGGGYMPCTPSGETKTHCESGGNTWSLAGTYGYPMPGGVCYARDSYGTRTGSQCPENIIPSGTEVVGVDQYPYVHMIGKHTAGLYCIRKTFYQGYVDNYYCNLAHEGAEQIGTDHSNVIVTNTCNAIDQNECTLIGEELCDATGSCVKTIVNGNQTGFTALEACKTVSSEKTTYDVCLTQGGQIVSTNQQTGDTDVLASDVGGWTVKRTYACGTTSSYDYTDALNRAASIEDSFSPDSALTHATYTDPVLGNTDISTIFIQDYGDCEYSCKIQKVTDKTTANAVTQQGEILAETESVSEFRRPCKLMANGSYVCPTEEDEVVVSDCQCRTDFNRIVTGLNLAKEVAQDMICAEE